MKFFFALLISISVYSAGLSQDSKQDAMLLKNTRFDRNEFDRKKSVWMFKDAKSGFTKYNPVSLLMGSMMFFYQSAISPQFSAHCLYSPSCSEFSKKLVNRYGIFKGVFLSADRLTRCNSFAGYNISPGKRDRKTGKVPESTDIYKSKNKISYSNR